MKPSTPNCARGRCDILTPKQSLVSQSCDLTNEMPSFVESGAVPGNCSGLWGNKMRVEFSIGDGGSDAAGSKSNRGSDTPTIGYEEIQTRNLVVMRNEMMQA